MGNDFYCCTVSRHFSYIWALSICILPVSNCLSSPHLAWSLLAIYIELAVSLLSIDFYGRTCIWVVCNFFISPKKNSNDTSCIRIMIMPLRKGNVAKQQCGDAKNIILQKNWLAHVGHFFGVNYKFVQAQGHRCYTFLEYELHMSIHYLCLTCMVCS